jgi:hypothetical protein
LLIGERSKALREQKNVPRRYREADRFAALLKIPRGEWPQCSCDRDAGKDSARNGSPLFQLFYDGEKPPGPKFPKIDDGGWGSSGRNARTLRKFRRLLGRASKADQKLLFFVAKKMSLRTSRSSGGKSTVS